VPPNNQQPPVAPQANATPVSPQAPPAVGSATASNTPPGKQGPQTQNTTQSSLLISEIRDSMVIMGDGSFRAVVACKSINFDLMSSREREGVEFSYQNFLNALYFPIQIFIRSQRVDIGPYIDRLVTIRRSQDNMLLNVLMDDYINFIDVLSQEANIMDKSFFIVVPYYPTGDLNNVVEQGKGFFGKIFGKKQAGPTRIDKVVYEKAKDEIMNRIESVTSGLFQIGVKSVQLNTKELGELYYNMYNPDTAVREPLGDFERVTSTYVQKGQGEAPRPHLQEGEM
jgi:type IV secretory pathway VirB4 component